MDRLTKRNAMLKASCKKNGTHDCLLEDDCEICDYNNKILEKLAHYEDLAEQGRLVELPCKVGDTVWRIIEMSTGKTLNRNGATVNPTIKRFIKPVKVTKNNLLDICETYGKKVFSTKEEAEAKLAEKGGGSDED